jgi:hypothetical protein
MSRRRERRLGNSDAIALRIRVVVPVDAATEVLERGHEVEVTVR